MIRSRVFLAISSLLVLLASIIFLFIDFRDLEDKAYDYFQKSEFEKILDLYPPSKKIDSELSIALLSQSVSALERKANETKTKEITLKFLKEKHPELKVAEWETSLGIYYHLEDPYILKLKKHSIHYKKSLIAKILGIQKPIPKDKVSHFILQLILEDPRGLEASYSQALANIIRMPMDSIGELEAAFLLETLHYLSSSSLSLFYENLFRVIGTNVNLRSGPGKENKEVGKVSIPDITFCFEKDGQTETVAGKTGYFIECFYPHLGKSAWVFSGFLENIPPNQKYISDLENRFKSADSEEKIDFVSWLGEKMPPGFYGTYIPRERILESGDVGFPLYGNQTKEYRKICKNLSGDKRYFEFSYLTEITKEAVPLLEINLSYKDNNQPVYLIELDHESIWINRNRYILDQGNKKQNLTLYIESRDGDKLVGSLKERNIGLLQNLKSYPIAMDAYQLGKTQWEICLPLAKNPTRDRVLLFEIKSGVN